MQGSRPPARPPPDSSRPRAATSASRAAWARGPAPGGPGRRSAASGAGRARAGVRARTPAPGPGPGPSERGKGRAPPAAPHLSNVENPNTSFKHLGNIRPPGTAHAPRRHRPLPRGPRPRRTHAPSQPRRPGVGLCLSLRPGRGVSRAEGGGRGANFTRSFALAGRAASGGTALPLERGGVPQGGSRPRPRLPEMSPQQQPRRQPRGQPLSSL